MTWDRREVRARIATEFITLGGGNMWDIIVDAAWGWRQLYLAQQCEEQRERHRWQRATPSGRARVRERKRNQYHAAKTRTVGVRGCVECGQLFAVSQMARARKKDRHCSLSCVAKARTRKLGGRFGKSIARQVVINGQARSRGEWAEHFGISLVSVHRRMTVLGMSEVEALSRPRRPGKRAAP